MNAHSFKSRLVFIAAFMLIVLSALLLGCGGGDDGGGGIIPPVDPNADPSRPSIFRLVPNSGAPGTVVEIQGINFGKEVSTSTVSYNGALLTVATGNDGKPRWSNTSIFVTIPNDAVTGLIIVSKSGKQSYAGKNAKFTVGTVDPGTEGDPVITSISPSSAQPGSVLTITGENFGTSRGASLVRIGTVACEINTRVEPTSGDIVEKWTSSNVEIIVPTKEEFGDLPQILPISIIVGGITSNMNFEFTVEDINPTELPVVISSVTPLRGEVGQTIEIRGQNFGNQIADSFVTFNGIRARVVSWENTKILINVPQGAENGDLAIVVNDTSYPIPGETPPAGLTYPITFDVIVAAEITGVSPVNVQLGGLVTLHGKHFGTDAGSITVEMGGNAQIIGQDAFGADANHVWTNDTVTFVLPNDIDVDAKPNGTFAPGSVQLTTSDDRVADKQTITLVNAFDGMVSAEFEAAPKGKPVSFQALVVGSPSGYEFDWDFNDGIGGASQSVTHSFTSVKKYRPKVRVTSKASGKASLFVGPEINIGESGFPAIGSLKVTEVNATEPPLSFGGTIVRSSAANLGKRIAHLSDKITIQGYNFDQFEGGVDMGKVVITRRGTELTYNGNVIIDPDSGSFAWVTDEFTGRSSVTFTIAEQNASMSGDLRIFTTNLVESFNSIPLIVEPRFISYGPQPCTVNDLITFVIYDTGFGETKIDGPADDAVRTAFLIIETPSGDGFIVSPASFSTSAASFDLGSWNPVDGSGTPIPKTAGTYTFYLWSCVLDDGSAEEVINSGIISEAYDTDLQ